MTVEAVAAEVVVVVVLAVVVILLVVAVLMIVDLLLHLTSGQLSQFSITTTTIVRISIDDNDYSENEIKFNVQDCCNVGVGGVQGVRVDNKNYDHKFIDESTVLWLFL